MTTGQSYLTTEQRTTGARPRTGGEHAKTAWNRTYPGAGDDERRLLDLDGQGFANISDLENKKFRPF